MVADQVIATFIVYARLRGDDVEFEVIVSDVGFAGPTLTRSTDADLVVQAIRDWVAGEMPMSGAAD